MVDCKGDVCWRHRIRFKFYFCHLFTSVGVLSKCLTSLRTSSEENSVGKVSHTSSSVALCYVIEPGIPSQFQGLSWTLEKLILQYLILQNFPKTTVIRK